MNKLGKLTIKDYAFVGIQFLLFLIYVFPFKILIINLPEWIKYIGLILAISGLVFGVIALLQINYNLSPFPAPKSNSQLITNGAFSISRHPIYTSILFITLGYAVYDLSLFKLLIFLLLWVLFYYKIKYEEQLLEEKFSEYSDYKKQTRRFI